jgi:hypothetical protein
MKFVNNTDYRPTFEESERGDIPPEVMEIDLRGPEPKVWYTTNWKIPGEPRPYEVRYALTYTGKRPKLITWTLAKGWDVGEHQGSWALKGFAGGKTQLTYKIRIGIYEDYEFVVTTLLAQSKRVVEGLKSHVELAWEYAKSYGRS